MSLVTEQLLDAETGVLGAMLLDEAAVGPMLLAVEAEDFHTPERRAVFQAIRRRYGAGEPVDPVLISEDLGPQSRELIYRLMELTPTASNADAYAAALKRASRLWRLQEIGRTMAEAVDPESCQELVDKANLLFAERSGIRRVTMGQAVEGFFARRGGEPVEHLRWGFSDLDDWLHVGAGDMVVIGGHASSGKTAFGLQVAFGIARSKRVGFYSYETGADKLADRIIACQTLTSYGRMMGNTLTEQDYANVLAMRPHLTAPCLDLLEASGMTVASIGAYSMAHHYDVVIVDYLQKIPAARDGRPLSEFDRVSQVSSDLQQLGRTTGKTVIALSQLSRGERDKAGHTKAPTISSLRQSGQIEQDADVVMLLYRERSEDYSATRRVLDVVKNKDGIAGRGMLLEFDGDTQRFKRSIGQPVPVKSPKEDGPKQLTFRDIPEDYQCPF